jgi:tRNA 2-selenouridine synthase
LFTALINLPTDGPVFVEAESRKIGCIHLPQPLLIALRAAPTMQIKAELIYRTTHIINDYQEMREDAAFASAMEVVGKYMERQRLAQWCRWQQAGEWEQLVADLLVSFYDVGYRQSLSTNYAATGDCYHVNPNDNESLEEVARALIAHSTTQHFSSDKIEVC